MAKIEPLNPDAHRHVHVSAQAGMLGENTRHFVPVISEEFSRLAAHYPIVLAKSAETGAFFAGAMLGIESGHNLFFGKSREREVYLPLDLRRAPFFTSGESLAIDLEHPGIDPIDGESLFDDDLQPTTYLRSVQVMMTQLKYGIVETSRFVDLLLALKLVEPIDISLRFDDGTRHRLDGLYTVSSDRLHMLPDADVISLFHSGDLRLIYAMIGSLEQIPVLARMHNDHLSRGI